MNTLPKISVIIPVYKAEKYLYRCIDSLLAQTFKDFELLLVDDGSPDNSGKICDEYAKRDKRIRVFHKKNGGVSSARNLGINNAKGEWIAFVDSDDWVSINFLSFIQEVDSEIDIIHFGYKKEISHNNYKSFCNFKKKETLDLANFFNNKCYSSCAWSYFFLTKFIHENKIRYTETIKYSEDREFILKCLFITEKKIQLSPYNEYVYAFNPSSAVNSKRTYQHCKDNLCVLDSIYQYIENRNIQIPKNINKYISHMLIKSHMRSLSLTCENYQIYVKQAQEDLRNTCSMHPTINTNYNEYKAFMIAPHITIYYYRLRNWIKRFTRDS